MNDLKTFRFELNLHFPSRFKRLKEISCPDVTYGIHTKATNFLLWENDFYRHNHKKNIS